MSILLVRKYKIFNTLCPRYCRFRLTQCTTKITQKNKRVIVTSSPFSPPPPSPFSSPHACLSRAHFSQYPPKGKPACRLGLEQLSAVNPKEEKGFLCVWLLYYVNSFCQFANGGTNWYHKCFPLNTAIPLFIEYVQIFNQVLIFHEFHA